MITMASQNHAPFPLLESNINTSDWYSSGVPATAPFGDFDLSNPYITSFSNNVPLFSPPNTADFQHKFTTESQSSLSKEATAGPQKSHFGSTLPSNDFMYGFVPVDNTIPARPRSSPSTFSPIVGNRFEDLTWSTHGLGFMPHSKTLDATNIASEYPSLAVRAPRLSEPKPPNFNPGDLMAPQPRRLYPTIAPNPNNTTPTKLVGRKHSREEDNGTPDDSGKRRKRADSAALPTELNEEDKLLIKLKDEESLPWKDIAARFQSDLGKTYQIPALQMRLKRLRERLRVWTEPDLKALRLAHEYWIQNKYEIIASKMIEFGASERWSARQCARKWQEIDPGPTPYSTYDQASTTPSYSQQQTHSPVETPAFLPFLSIPS